MSQMNPVHNFPPCFPKIHSNIFPITPSSSEWSLPYRISNQNIACSSRGLLVMTRCSVAVGYQRFRGSCCLHLHPEDGESTASQPKRPRLVSSPQWKPQISSQDFVCICHFCHACNMRRPSHSPWFDHPNNIWWSLLKLSTISSLLGPHILFSSLSQTPKVYVSGSWLLRNIFN